MLSISTCTAPAGTFSRRVPRKGSPSNLVSVSTERPPNDTSENGQTQSGGLRLFTGAPAVNIEASRRLLRGNMKPELLHRAADVRNEVNDLFAQVDRDCDGLISLADVRRIFSRLDGGLPREVPSMFFRKDIGDNFKYIDRHLFMDILLVMAKNISEDKEIKDPLLARPSDDVMTDISSMLLGGFIRSTPPERPGSHNRTTNSFRRKSLAHPSSRASSGSRGRNRRSGSPHDSRLSSVSRDINSSRAEEGKSSPCSKRRPSLEDIFRHCPPRLVEEQRILGEVSRAQRQTRMYELRDILQAAPSTATTANQGLSINWPTPAKNGIRPGNTRRSSTPLTSRSVFGNSAKHLPVAPQMPKHKVNKQTTRPSSPMFPSRQSKRVNTQPCPAVAMSDLQKRGHTPGRRSPGHLSALLGAASVGDDGRSWTK